MDAVRLDPSMVKEDSLEWKLYDETPEYRRFAALDEAGNLVIKTEPKFEEELIASNKERFEQSLNQRYEDGRVVASVPMNIWSREIAPRLVQGDLDFSAWWLDRPENAPWRTFKGRVQKK